MKILKSISAIASLTLLVLSFSSCSDSFYGQNSSNSTPQEPRNSYRPTRPVETQVESNSTTTTPSRESGRDREGTIRATEESRSTGSSRTPDRGR